MSEDEDWRVEVELADSVVAGRFHETLAALGARPHDGGAEADALFRRAKRQLGHTVALSHDDNRVFAYATTREAAEAAEQTLRQVAADDGVAASFTLTRWHPDAETWEDPDAPLPADPAAIASEQREGHEAEQQTEAAESADAGPELEVRLTLASHQQAREIAQRLAAEGIPTQRHWRYLLVGARTEDDANALAERLRGELGSDAQVRVELTVAFVERESHIPLGPISLIPFGPQ